MTGRTLHHSIRFWPALVLALGLGVAAPPAYSAHLLDAPFYSFDLGATEQPQSIAVGDLNLDGRPDVVTIGPGTLSVLFGEPDGRLGHKIDRAVATNASFPSLVDLNGDGKLDLVLMSDYLKKVYVYLGNGNGTFGTPTEYSMSQRPVSKAIADLNGDGVADIAVTYDYPDTMSVFPGNPDGTFGARVDYATEMQSASVAASDLNGDGQNDLVLAQPGRVGILLADGLGGFEPITSCWTNANIQSVAVGDLNGDGHVDVVTENDSYFNVWPIYPHSVSILLGNGDGTFAVADSMGTNALPFLVVLHDLNGDGKLDLLLPLTPGPFAHSQSSAIEVMLGHGDGSFEDRAEYGTGLAPMSIAVDDMNGDGKVDLAIPCRGSNSVALMPGNGDGSFGPNTVFPTDELPTDMALGDLNGDGWLDLVVANHGDAVSTVSVLLGGGNGTFGPATNFGTADSPDHLAIGDLNGDGKLDLATASGSGTFSVLLGAGDGTFGTHSDYTVGSIEGMALGDLNHDGKPDLCVTNTGATTVAVYLGNGNGTFGPVAKYGTGAYPRNVAIGDLDGDGTPDLAVGNTNASVSVLRGNGDGTFQNKIDYPTGNYLVALAIGDVNGDGRPDLAMACSGDSAKVLLGQPGGSFATMAGYHVGVAPTSIAICDLDSDGKPDLVVACSNLDGVSVLLGNGNGTFRDRTDLGTGTSPIAVAIGDFNADGRLDVAAANLWSSDVAILLNTWSTLAVGADVLPAGVELATPFPNPSRSHVQLRFAVPAAGRVRLEIYDAQGRRIRTLVDELMTPGRYARTWNGAAPSGSQVRTGVYFVRLSANGLQRTRKTLILR